MNKTFFIWLLRHYYSFSSPWLVSFHFSDLSTLEGSVLCLYSFLGRFYPVSWFSTRFSQQLSRFHHHPQPVSTSRLRCLTPLTPSLACLTDISNLIHLKANPSSGLPDLLTHSLSCLSEWHVLVSSFSGHEPWDHCWCLPLSLIQLVISMSTPVTQSGYWFWVMCAP